jgi:hypothetical protein
MNLTRALCAALVFSTLACAPEGASTPGEDTGATNLVADAGSADSGADPVRIDAGTGDAGPGAPDAEGLRPDAGVPDSGAPDSGVAAPSLSIDSPSSGAVVQLGTDAERSLPVSFTVKGFVLKTPGTCAGASGCGHVHLGIDGAACNAQGQSHNVEGAASPLVAKLGLCPFAPGPHTLTLALHTDDHSKVKDAAGAAIEASVQVQATGTPAVRILSPFDGSIIEHASDADKTVPVKFDVTDLRLAPAGTCGKDPACGHVHLLVDGASCNAAGEHYNNSGTASPLSAKVARCLSATGRHTLTVQLHRDDHSPLNDPLGKHVAASTAVVVVAPGDFPSLAVIRPTAGATVGVGNTGKAVTFEFKADHFTLAPAGTCGSSPTCGHVHLLVDGNNCNAPGSPYNAAGSGSTLVGKLAFCPQDFGHHRAVLELHRDDHSPVTDPSGTTLSADTVFWASPAGEPDLYITRPADRTSASAANDSDRTVSVDFVLTNFALKTPGSCAGLGFCGHAHLLVDGHSCDAVGQPYNNSTSTKSVDARLKTCPAVEGNHSFEVRLHADDHKDIRDGSGHPITAHRNAYTSDPMSSAPSIGLLRPSSGSIVTPVAGADHAVPVHFQVDHFTLKPPGGCGGLPSCGHVHATVDGAACNAKGLPYNAAGAESPLVVRLGRCAEPAGTHLVRLSLHGDDHVPVKTAGGAGVFVESEITACEAGKPCVAIVAPRRGESVAMGTSQAIPIDFVTENFVLRAAGTCGATQDCGHVHLQVDGAVCNPSGQPFNNSGAKSPLDAKLSTCPAAAGLHTVSVSLHRDDHSPVKNGRGAPVASTVRIGAK